MNFVKIVKKFLLNEEFEKPTVFSYIQALSELLNALTPHSVKEKHMLLVAIKHLVEIKKHVKRLEEELRFQKESVIVNEEGEKIGMDEICSSCKGAFHPSTGSEFGNIKLCWECTLDFIQWLKKREAQMSKPKKGMKTSFTQAALSSIKPEQKEK